MDSFLLLSIGVNDFMRVPKIYKSESVETEISSIDKPNIVRSALLVEFYQKLSIIVIQDYNTGVFGDIDLTDDIHHHWWVQFPQLGQGSLGTCHFPDVFFLRIEVLA